MSLDIGIDDDPIAALRRWYHEAEAALPLDEAHSIALATVGPAGAPAVRVVLCREIRDDGRMFFFTNYDSRKGRELAVNPAAAAMFHWRKFGRQCRVEGRAEPCAAVDSDAYWASRPRESQLSALASPQSQAIQTFEELDRRREELRVQHDGREIPRPSFWGGYALVPSAIEFWSEGTSRLHQRLRFSRTDDQWRSKRVGP